MLRAFGRFFEFLQSRNCLLATFIDSYPLCSLLKDTLHSKSRISWIRMSSSCRRFFLSSSLVSYVAFALVDGEQGSDANKRLASASEGLLNCLAREIYATREECANANCESANESTSVKDVQNEEEQPIVCNCLRIYVYVCVYARPRVLEI